MDTHRKTTCNLLLKCSIHVHTIAAEEESGVVEEEAPVEDEATAETGQLAL